MGDDKSGGFWEIVTKLQDLHISGIIKDVLGKAKKAERKIEGLEDKIENTQSFLRHCELPQEYVAGLVQRFKKDHTKTNPDWQKYRIVRDWGYGHSAVFPRQKGEIYHDAQYSFVLCYESQQIAHIGFDVLETRINVHQIQGVKGQKERLDPIKWERALLTLVCEWAETNRYKEVSVEPVKANRWAKVTLAHFRRLGLYKEGTTIEDAAKNDANTEQEIKRKAREILGDEQMQLIKLMPGQGYQLYDVNAQKCGFEYDKQKENYVKFI